MAFDGAFLSCLRAELQDTLRDARIDKIHQPSREELVLSLRRRNGAEKLYISARANSPRIHFTAVPLENPAQPPMFCMLLRKRMTGGRLAAIRQPGLERALYLDFDCVNELGDIVRLTLAVEIMEYGAAIRSLWVHHDGVWTDAVLGYDTLREYEENDGYLGACIGRVGNRIGGAAFTLNGKVRPDRALCKAV